MSLAAAALVWAWPRPEGQWLRTNASQMTQASLDAGRKAVQAVRDEVKSAKWKLGSRPRGPEPSVLVLADSGPSGPPCPPGHQTRGRSSCAGRSAVPAGEDATERRAGADYPSRRCLELRHLARHRSPAPSGPPPIQASFPHASSGRVCQEPAAGHAVADLPEVELVVSAAGEVESVKLVSPGRGTQPGMQLSAIKAWRYEPATRGGQPVRYRLRVRLPVQ